jgi:predicted DNA repair protein MutK
MRLLSIVGTAAMFLVGGGILVHGIPPLHHAIEALAAGAGGVAGVGGLLKGLLTMLLDGLVGIVAGAIVLGGVLATRRLFGKKAAATP